MAKTKSNNRRTKTSTRRKRGGLFGYDVRGKMAKAMGKPEDAFKPADMGIRAAANEMGTSMKEGAHSMGARAQQMMGPGQGSAPVARGGRRRRGSRKTKRSMKSKKSKKPKKSRKTRRGRRRH
jgi:hypothetical protein